MRHGTATTTHANAMMRQPKYTALKDFLHCLTSDNITQRQKKALLLQASRIQRLGLIEITLNVTYGNIDLDATKLDDLRKYRLGLRRICNRGSSGNNQLLANNLPALVLVLKIALEQPHPRPTHRDENVSPSHIASDGDEKQEQPEKKHPEESVKQLIAPSSDPLQSKEGLS